MTLGIVYHITYTPNVYGTYETSKGNVVSNYNHVDLKKSDIQSLMTLKNLDETQAVYELIYKQKLEAHSYSLFSYRIISANIADE
jgi:hypothetical protein